MNRGLWFALMTLTATLLIAWGRSGQLPRIEDLADGKVRPAAEKGVSEAYLPLLFPSSHASNLHVLPNGDLLCVWFSGEAEGKSNVAILMSRLPHGTREWTKPQVLSQQSGRSAQNPVLFSAPGGRLWLFHTSQIADEGQKNSEVRFLTSDDGGKSWSQVKPLFQKPGSFIRHPLVVLGGGEWLLPMYYTPEGSERHYSAIKISKDHGKTWSEYVIEGSNGLVQPNVVKLSDGSLVAFFRSRYADWIYKSISRDGGRTWTTPEPTQLPNNNSSFQVTRLKNGHLVLVFNNTNAGDKKEKIRWGVPRKPLSIALSMDEGKTWPWVRDLHTGDEPPPLQPGEREEYSYPSIVQTSDGALHVTFTFRRKTIKYITFDEKWIQQGTTVGKFKGDKDAQN